MANDKPAPRWRNFAAWSGVGAVLCGFLMWSVSSLLHGGGMGAIFSSKEIIAIVGLALVLASAVIGFSNWSRPVSPRALGGLAIANAVAIGAFLLIASSFEAGDFREAGGSAVAAFAVGAVFLVIGAMIAAGLASPTFGARYLNVEDAGDLREQRPVLWRSAGAMAAWGLMLAVLAASWPSGPISPPVALVAAAVLMAIVAWLTFAAWRHMDELMRRLSTEGGNMSYYLVALAGGGWAMLAHLGFAPAPAPLDWLTMLTGLALPASFIVAGRRGLLTQRSR